VSTPYAKTGPLTAADIQAIWKASNDKSYTDPLIAAGEGNGFEAWTQAFQQWARVSLAVDVSTQAMYFLPWSGQTAPPASGAKFATVTLTLARTGFVQLPLVLEQGQIVVDEETQDWGENPGDPGQTVLTGRRYVLTQTVVFQPGDVGPLTATATAEAPGFGYNNPLPGTIVAVEQPGSGYTHDRATVALVGPFPPGPPSPAPAQIQLITVNEADTFVPQHVGQYVEMVGGVNTGQVARVSGYVPPDPVANVGAVAKLALDVSVESFSPTGTFIPGELATITNGATLEGDAVVQGATLEPNGHLKVTVTLTDGSVAHGWTVNGLTSGATAPVDVVLTQPGFSAEAPPIPATPGTGAVWRVLDWALDWGLTCTNPLSPQGGRSATLDAIAADRSPRQVGEGDEQYRARVAQVADVVSPNAVFRALNRSPLPCTMLEVGTAAFPGLYLDLPLAEFDSYDTDVVMITGAVVSGALSVGFDAEMGSIRDSAGNEKARGWVQTHAGAAVTVARVGLNPYGPGDVAAGDVLVGLSTGARFSITSVADTSQTRLDTRLHVALDYVEFRGFFLVQVPALGGKVYGDFGCAFDQGTGTDAFDCSPDWAFFDGFPTVAAQQYLGLWQAVGAVKAGGVGYDFVLPRTAGSGSDAVYDVL